MGIWWNYENNAFFWYSKLIDLVNEGEEITRGENAFFSITYEIKVTSSDKGGNNIWGKQAIVTNNWMVYNCFIWKVHFIVKW